MTRKSERREAAERIAALAAELTLDEVYAGGVAPPSAGKNYYGVLLCRRETVDGSVRVYGPSFITVVYKTAIRTLPHTEHATLRSVEQAEAFLRSRFGSVVEASHG
jgi:hypothetical protein